MSVVRLGVITFPVLESILRTLSACEGIENMTPSLLLAPPNHLYLILNPVGFSSLLPSFSDEGVLLMPRVTTVRAQRFWKFARCARNLQHFGVFHHKFRDTNRA
jgi:hypothetical protein